MLISGAINLESEEAIQAIELESEKTNLIKNNPKCPTCSNHYCTCYALRPKINTGPFYTKHDVCLICDETFASKTGVHKHLRRTMCGIGDMEKLEFMKEFQKYFRKDADIVICKNCEEKFDAFITLIAHLKTSKCGIDKVVKPLPKIVSSDGFRFAADGIAFQCNFCNHVVKSKNGMRWHINHQHKPRKDYRKFYVKENGRILCSNCFKPYSTFNALSIHLDTNKTGCGEEPISLIHAQVFYCF